MPLLVAALVIGDCGLVGFFACAQERSVNPFSLTEVKE
jgi:hypothetical protein